MGNINNILVIGNGFDLACNYDTRYADFINFVKLISKDREKIHILPDEHIKSFIQRFDERKEKIEENTKYRELLNIINKSCFIKHFVSLNYDINIWSDVEEEMHRIIKAINMIFNDNNLNNQYIRNVDASKQLCLDCNDEYVKKVLLEFEIIEKNCVAFKNANLHLLNGDFYDYVYKIKWKNLNNYLNEQLNLFKKALSIYLNEFVPIIKSIYFDEITERQLRECINPNYIITFNYTNFYQDFYDCDFIHVHGNLKDMKIVLGFEEDNTMSIRYCRFFKYFQRIQNRLQILKRTDKIFNVPNINDNIFEISKEKKNNIISFYGVSFDITDEDYIKELYDSENNIKIIVYYYDDSDYDAKIINLIKIFSKETITNDIYSGKLELVQIAKEDKTK